MVDISDSMYVGAVLLGVVLALVGISVLYTTYIDDSVTVAPVTEEHRTDVRGTPYTVSESAFNTICLSQNCPPAVNSQSFQEAETVTWLEPSDPVVGLMVDEAAYAFPVRVLRWHPVVNTYMNGRPAAVTYDPYTGTAAVYDRFLDEVREFAPTGKIYNGGLVLRDDSGSDWSQYTGTAVRGDHTGTTLARMDAQIVRWSIWESNHPDSSVLMRPGSVYNISRFADDPFVNYRRSTTVPFHTFTDDRLSAKDPVIGVVANDSAVAFREVLIKDQELVQGVVGDIPIAVVQDEQAGKIHVFDRRTDNTTRFFVWQNDSLYDLKTDERFRPDGTEITEDPARIPVSLPTLDHTRSYFFAWALHHPDTRVYGTDQ